jgi:hypothetical protein
VFLVSSLSLLSLLSPALTSDLLSSAVCTLQVQKKTKNTPILTATLSHPTADETRLRSHATTDEDAIIDEYIDNGTVVQKLKTEKTADGTSMTLVFVDESKTGWVKTQYLG